MSDKIQIGIYRLKQEVVEVEVGKKPIKVSVDIDFLTNKFTKAKFKQQRVKENLTSGFEIYLYFKRSSSSVKWKGFIEKIAEEDTLILKNKELYNESYVLILKNIKTDIIYASTGGYGHMAIQDIAESDFGLEILSRIVKADDKALVSTKEKNIVGGVLGSTKFFRTEYNLNENDSFGNFYQELQASIDKLFIENELGVEGLEFNCLCVARNSFTIKKSISFEQLISLVQKIENLISSRAPIVEINGVRKLGKSEKALIECLWEKLDLKIYDIYLNCEDLCNVELCHKDFEKYLSANTCSFRLGSGRKSVLKQFDSALRNLIDVINIIRGVESEIEEVVFKKMLSESKIVCFNSEGNILTSDMLRNHYYTEIEYCDKNYFLSDNDWFEIKDTFTKKLNDQCNDFIRNHGYKGFLQGWDLKTEKENEYNAKHIGEKCTLVLDKILPDNIEACDILKWDNDRVYFIHVKLGFNQTFRDLTNQVSIAARRIKESISGDKKFIKELFIRLKENMGSSSYFQKAKSQLDTMDIDDFLDIFQGKKIVFVLAVLDSANKDRTLKNMEAFDSNIAKFSLQELVKNMRILDVELEIVEIKKLDNLSKLTEHELSKEVVGL